MDGSDLKPVVENVYVQALTVDQEAALLYWLDGSYSEAGTTNLKVIMYSGLNGENTQRLMMMEHTHDVLGLSIVGSWIYWWEELDSNQLRLFKCNARNGNDIGFQDIIIEQHNRFLFLPHSLPTKSKGPCIGQLCSHICVPSPNGYMRCLCPTGYALKPNGWSCGK